jgi:prepilin-type N-terminal cleavage/methylation domain-containing protein
MVNPGMLRRRFESLLGRRLSSEAGVTLVEMVMVVAILSVILGYVMRGFLTFESVATGARLRLQNIEQARVVMDVATKDLRTATRLSSATSPFDVGATSLGLPTAPAPGAGNGNAAPYAGASEVWFYANLNLNTTSPDPCPSIVHLYLDTAATPTQVKEQVLTATAGGAPPSCAYTGAYTTRVVAKYISNTGAQPVFTYYYDNGTGTPVAFTAAQTPLAATDRLLVNAVGISLYVKEGTSTTVPATALVNRTRLPNVYYNPAGE